MVHLLGYALRGLLALEMLLHQIPNEAARRRALLAQRVQLGFERLGELNQHANHFHGSTSLLNYLCDIDILYRMLSFVVKCNRHQISSVLSSPRHGFKSSA